MASLLKDRRLRLEDDLENVKTRKDPQIIKKIEDILGLIKRGESVTGLWCASDSDTKREMILSNDDVKFLTANPDVSIPLMHQQLEEKKIPYTDTDYNAFNAVSVYFFVFGETRSIKSIPYLVDYILSVPEDDCLGNFIYAVESIRKITNGQGFRVKGEMKQLFDQRFKIATQVQKWYLEHL
jgi:hypothetical protein